MDWPTLRGHVHSLGGKEIKNRPVPDGDVHTKAGLKDIGMPSLCDSHRHSLAQTWLFFLNVSQVLVPESAQCLCSGFL